jgi:hypothetical protein
MRTKSRRALSDRDIEELAHESATGYDLATAKRRRVGRPSLGHGTSPRVQFRIEADVFEKAKQKAAAESRSLSDVGRELFTEYAASQEKRRRESKPRRRTRS